MYCAIIALLASVYPIRNATDRFNILESSASNSLSISASSNSAASGETIDLTAAMPVVAAGSTTQTLTQIIDPTKVKLTSASDITYPAGWTLSYSTDGTSFSSTAPTTSSGWAAVRAVRATGDLVSSGSSNGFQVASKTATGTAQSIAPSSITISGTGDGFQAFFDPGRTRVFNVFHHQATGTAGGQLDCYVIATGTRCTGFPLDMGIGRTPQSSIGRVVGNTIWVPAYKSLPSPDNAAVGFFCVNISAVLASGTAPSMCATPFVEMARGSAVLYPFAGFNVENDLYAFYLVTGAGTSGSSSETKLWSVLSSNGKLVCLDTATRAACSGMPTGGWSSGLAIGGYGGIGADIEIWNDRIYIRGNRANNSSTPGVVCVQATNPSLACTGWTNPLAITPNASPIGTAANTFVGKLFPLPNSSGQIEKMCLGPDGRHVTQVFNQNKLTASSTAISCWDAAGAKTDGPSGLSSLMTATWSVGSSMLYAIDYSVLGTRIAWSDGVNYSNTTPEPPAIACWDVALNGPCTTANLGTTTTANGQVTYSTATGFGGAGAKNYTAVIDPIAPSCLWVMQNDNPRIFLLNVVDGTSNCSAGAPTAATFSGSAIVPRMACNSNQDAIRQWESFTLKTAGTGTFTSATLTVKNSSGVAISGWTDRAVSLNTALPLSGLSPGDTGLTPSFEVAFGGISGSITTASAEVKVVGDSPELCTRVTAVYTCPSGSGPINSLTNSTVTVSANGSSVLGGATTTLPQVDQSITVTAPALTACTSSITGRTGDGGGGSSGTAISGVTVSLLDSSGNPVLVNGSPVTTTTASDGTYSFAGLLPNSYKVRFDEPGVQVLASSTVVSGATGTTTGASTVSSAATSATSNVAATVVGTGAVVNALFVVPAAATADIPAAGTQGVAQTINVLSNDSAASGSTLTASTVRFCGVSPTQTPPSCSQTTLTTADGSYSVNTSTGVVTFTPNASFTGTATQPPRYQVTDSASNVVSATITPSVIARPTLTADTSSGAWDQNQTISPLTNDVAGSGATLVATSVKLCGSSDTAPNCTANSLTITGQGTYTVVSDGTITFDPVSSFTGTATPVTYSVTDSVGQKTATTITPTVLVPVAPVAKPQSKLVLPTGTAAFTTITGANGLATGTQLSPSQTFLCGVAPNAQTPPNCNATTVTTADGTWVLSQTTGVVTYQPNAGTSTGTKTAVMYQVTDPIGQSASAALTPVIPPAPTANPDTSTGRQAVAQLISLLGNDQPGLPSSPIDVGSVKFCVGNQVAPNCGATSLTVSGEGTYEINSLGIVTFRPLASFLGTATTITYQISDSLGQSASSTLTVTVIPPPVAVPTDDVESGTNVAVLSPVPVAIRDLGFGAYGKSVVFEPWANDSGGNKPKGSTQQDPQVVPTSIRLCAVGQSAPKCAATTITTPDGSYKLETSTGKVTFTPVAGFTGTATAPITYQISNNWSGPSGAATTTAILIPIIGAPGDPIAKNDDTTTKPETPVTLKPIANDIAGSSALNPTTLRLCLETDIAPNCTQLSVTNIHGTYIVNPTSGAVTFTPAKGFTGLATIPYVVSAMNSKIAYAHLTITVGDESANQSPAGDLPQTGTSVTELFALVALLLGISVTALIMAKKV